MEFQPVVLAAGRGSRMTDLTATTCKALLPIGNKPMLWYPINTLQKAGFDEAIVVVLESYVTETQKLLEMCNVKMKLDIVGISDQDYTGTADTLRQIRDKIKRDILVISCDLVMDVSLHHIANIYRTYDASLTMLLCAAPEQANDVPVPGPKTKKRSERDFIGFDEKGSRVLFMTSEADLADTDNDKIKFRKSLLKRHPNINIKSSLTDCHLYLMKKWVVDYLAEDKNISSIKGELVPLLIRKQFSKQKTLEPTNTTGSIIEMDTKKDIFSFIPDKDPSLSTHVQQMSTWIDHRGDMAECYHGSQIRCYAYTVRGGLCVRTNTVSAYCDINRQIPRFLLTLDKDLPNIHPSATVKGKPQIGSDCLVGEQAIVGEKVSVKRSILGHNCEIADKVKISGSIIMKNVQIGEGSSVQGCIICDSAQVSEKCELKDCIVGGGQVIPAGSNFANEALVAEEEMMEI